MNNMNNLTTLVTYRKSYNPGTYVSLCQYSHDGKPALSVWGGEWASPIAALDEARNNRERIDWLLQALDPATTASPERSNETVAAALRAFSALDQSQWDYYGLISCGLCNTTELDFVLSQVHGLDKDKIWWTDFPFAWADGPWWHGAGSSIISRARNVTADTLEGSEGSEGFTGAQLSALRDAMADVRTIDPAGDTYPRLCSFLDSLPAHLLCQLARADIRFISQLANNRFYRAMGNFA